MRLRLSICPVWGAAGVLKASLGYFSSTLASHEAGLIADLLWSFKEGDARALVATYLFEESLWEEAERLGWRVLRRKTFTRKGLFPRAARHEWAVGVCSSAECLREVVHTGWGLSGNESFIVLLTQTSDDVLSLIERTYQDDLETVEENERRWVEFSRLVSSRDHDGLTLRLYTAWMDEDHLRRHLAGFLKSASTPLEFSDEAL